MIFVFCVYVEIVISCVFIIEKIGFIVFIIV